MEPSGEREARRRDLGPHIPRVLQDVPKAVDAGGLSREAASHADDGDVHRVARGVVHFALFLPFEKGRREAKAEKLLLLLRRRFICWRQKEAEGWSRGKAKAWGQESWLSLGEDLGKDLLLRLLIVIELL